MNLQVQIASMCMCINISASVALGCLFTPKVYLVLFQPYKNVRPGHTNVSTKLNDSNNSVLNYFILRVYRKKFVHYCRRVHFKVVTVEHTACDFLAVVVKRCRA